MHRKRHQVSRPLPSVAAVPGGWEPGNHSAAQAIPGIRRRAPMLDQAAGEPAGRPRRGLTPVRKVRAPQGRVVGNTDPG